MYHLVDLFLLKFMTIPPICNKILRFEVSHPWLSYMIDMAPQETKLAIICDSHGTQSVKNVWFSLFLFEIG